MAIQINPALQTSALTASDFKFVLNRSDNGAASIQLQQYVVTNLDSAGQPVKNWVPVASQSNAGWDDAIPWSEGSYELKYANQFAKSHSWNLQAGIDPYPEGRQAIKLHQGSEKDPSGPVHGCIGASVSFLNAAKNALEKAGVLYNSIVCEVNNDYDYKISISSSPPSINEGDDATITINLSSSISKNLFVRVVDYNESPPSGEATYTKDYSIIPSIPMKGSVIQFATDQFRPGSSQFAAKYQKGWYVEVPRGATSVTYKVHVNNDAVLTPAEGNENIKFKIDDYFVEDDYNGTAQHGKTRGYYSDYLTKTGTTHGVLLGTSTPSAPITIIDQGNLLSTSLNGGIEGLQRTFNVTKGDIISYNFNAFSIKDKMSIIGGTKPVDTGGFISGAFSGTLVAAGDTISVIVVGSDSGTAWSLSLVEQAPPPAMTSFSQVPISAQRSFLLSNSMSEMSIPTALAEISEDTNDQEISASRSLAVQSIPNASLISKFSQSMDITAGSTSGAAQMTVEAGKDYLIRLAGSEIAGKGTLVDGYIKIYDDGSTNAKFDVHTSELMGEASIFFHATTDGSISVVAGSDRSSEGGTATLELYDASQLNSSIVFISSPSIQTGLEGDQIQLQLNRIGDLSQISTYRLLVSPDGTSPLSTDDFVGGLSPIDVTFQVGQSTANVVIDPIQDSRAEGVETATIFIDPASLSSESLANSGVLGLRTAAQIEVSDAPASREISFPTIDASNAEGFAGDGTIGFRVRLSEAPNTAVTISYVTVDGSAVSGEGYSPVGGQITFNPGETERFVSVPLLVNPTTTQDTTLQLKLLDPTGLYLPGNVVVQTVTGTIHVGVSQWTPEGSLNDFGFSQGWADDRTERYLVDVNGDGKSDLIGFGHDYTFLASGIEIADSAGSLQLGLSSPSPIIHDFGVSQNYTAEMQRGAADTGQGVGKTIYGQGYAGVYWYSASNQTTAQDAKGNNISTPIYDEKPNLYAEFGKDQGWSEHNSVQILKSDIADQYASILGFGNLGIIVGENAFAPNADASAAYTILGAAGNANGWNQTDDVRTFLDKNGKTLDFNKDGVADFLGMGPQGTVYAFGSKDGAGHFDLGEFQTAIFGQSGSNLGRDQGWTSQNHERLIVHNSVTGYDDIFAFGDAGVYVAQGQDLGSNNGQPFGELRLALANFGTQQGWSNDLTPRVVGDVNGDGIADIVGFGANSTFVALGSLDSTGSLHFALDPSKTINDFGYNQGWNANTLRTLADVDGSGHDSLVLSGGAGTQIWHI